MQLQTSNHMVMNFHLMRNFNSLERSWLHFIWGISLKLSTEILSLTAFGNLIILNRFWKTTFEIVCISETDLVTNHAESILICDFLYTFVLLLLFRRNKLKLVINCFEVYDILVGHLQLLCERFIQPFAPIKVNFLFLGNQERLSI